MKLSLRRTLVLLE